MAQGLGRRLSAQDASFLYFEREEAPLHIGSMAVFEGQVSYERFVENVESKLHLIPRYMQRAVPAPLNIDHPTWEWDPEFDIRRHVTQVTIEAPGTDAQLMQLAADLFAPMLDRGKPLWEMFIVNGIDGNRSALVSKVHHCLVDGVSGIELLMIVLDVSATPVPPVLSEIPPPRPIPSATSRLIDAIFDRWAFNLDRFLDAQAIWLEAATTGDGRLRAMRSAFETTATYLREPMQRAPFNKPLRGGRKIAGSEFSFAEIRAIRAACGGTVNDVVLAVLGGALGRYLEMHGESTDNRMIRIMTPVNVRQEGERQALGNRVSMLIVDVPVGEHDPVARLKVITERTDELKRAKVADGAAMINEMLSGGPPFLQALAAGAIQPANTIGNLVCTNVPGPMIPLYTVGQRMIAHYPLVPIAFEMGIGCGVTSFDQKLYFGLMADAEAAPDVDRLKEFLDQSFVELRSAAGVSKSDLPQLGVAATPEVARRRRTAAASRTQAMAADAG